MQNYNDNANVLLTVESAWYFRFLCVQGEHIFLWEEKQNWLIVFFIKPFLFYDDNVDQLL